VISAAPEGSLLPVPLNVLIADDDATTRALFSAFVRSMGYAVTAVADGREAWSVFEATEPQLLIIDWTMRGLNGLELCRRVRARVGDQSLVMVVSAPDGTECIHEALAAGADDYLLKPVSREQFHGRVMIAERRLAAAHSRRAAMDELARVRWLAGIGQTLLTLQHEINNPLTALYGSLESLSLSDNLVPTDRRNTRVALDQAERIADVVRRLSRAEHHATIEPIPGVRMLAVESERLTREKRR
jgi:DNA-binding response OmpR family regulator